MVILEEGNIHHPRCPLCVMLVPWLALNRMHWCTAQCKKGVELNRRRLAAEEEREVKSRFFSAYGISLDMLTSFKYFGQFISEADDNLWVLVKDQAKAQAVWRRSTRIIIR